MTKKINNTHPSEVGALSLRPYGTSIFTEMTRLAESHGAVNLSQGFPDFDGPEKIRKIAAEAILRGPNQYSPSIGIPAIREAISRKMGRFHGIGVDPDLEITVTAGATEGLCATLLGIIEPGDEIILLEPAYDAYAPIASLSGAVLKYVSLEGNHFQLPREKLARAFSARTRAIVINNPQNPCGKVYRREELEWIGRLCREYDAFAVSDEVYEHLVYDGRKHLTLLGFPDFRDRAFVISSTAKTFSMTGWKIGYVLAAPALSRAVRRSHQFITFCGPSAFQEAMAAAMNLEKAYYADLLSAYTRKKEHICNALDRLGFGVLAPEGAYYVLADIRPLGFEDDYEFCKMLPEKAGVAAVPCSGFWKDRRYGQQWVRFCFCKKDETLAEGVRRLEKWLKGN